LLSDAYSKMNSASGGWLLYKATGMICKLTQHELVLHYCTVPIVL